MHARTRTTVRIAILFAALGASLSVAPAARAEVTAAERETARSLVDEGDRRLAAGDLAGALKAYQGAHAIMGVPTTGIEVAKTLEKLGRLVESRETALAIASSAAKPGEPAVFAQARAESEQLAERLRQRIPALIVAVSGPPQGVAPRVTIDGAAIPPAALGLPRKLDPGKHVVAAAADGFRSATREITIREGQSIPLAIALEPGDAPASSGPGDAPASNGGSGLPVLGIVGFSVAAVGVGVGSVTGAMSLSKASEAKKGCVGNVCPVATESQSRAAASSSNTLANVSNVSFGVALAGLGLGVYDVFIAKHPKADEPAAASRAGIVVTPDWIGVAGKF